MENGAPILRVEIESTQGTPLIAAGEVDDAHVDIHLQGLANARLRMERDSGMVRYSFVDIPPAADVLHPCLAPAAAIVHVWAGREAIHAGAFITPAGTVLLLGGKEAGKSSVLAWLAAELDQQVLADDLCVLIDGEVLPGPCCVDLREPTVRRYGMRWGGRLVRSRDRTRLTLDPASAGPTAVAGIVVLGWAESVRFEPVPLDDRLGLLVNQRYFGGLEADPVALLDLIATPMFRLLRPRDLDVLPATAEALLAHWS
jgi:hypothetical protein